MIKTLKIFLCQANVLPPSIILDILLVTLHVEDQTKWALDGLLVTENFQDFVLCSD